MHKLKCAVTTAARRAALSLFACLLQVLPVAAQTPVPDASRTPETPARCDLRITLQSEELFPFSKATLTQAAQSRLERDLVGRLRDCASVDGIVVEGHTDRMGGPRFNQRLSQQRAEAVRKYLVSRGVPDERIETVGVGKAQPTQVCAADLRRSPMIACLAPDRRVVISIKGPAR